MKVKDLIALLKEQDENSLVMLKGYEGGVNDATSVSENNAILNENTEWYFGKHEIVRTPQEGGTYEGDKEPVKVVLIQ